MGLGILRAAHDRSEHFALGDPVFDGTLKQALAVQLEQSPYLNIVPDRTIRKALQFMGRSPDERVTGNVAREICERENIKAMLGGSIAALGSQYVVALDAVNCRTGDWPGSKSRPRAKRRCCRRWGRLRRACGESWVSRWPRFKSLTRL
jgi:hypothetical protein